ncbi:alkaline phosphatase D family protein [Shewanella sp. NIFS-20-20]|uniref:alkaline phosphatase D family protein n=1 Tax=Shewanella sp. NIFS-20-20 TaxID=2853806 RepID=UPI001C461FA4|nr:alkaline phosphatase D family protein [Shewanella sp. NIFS-20-20]MBV7315285.1 alkaline phosphatase family protein [Shewanella sp. NIFS-20-20]
MLRHCDSQQLTLWLVTSQPLTQLSLTVLARTYPLAQDACHCVRLGKHAWQYVLHWQSPTPLPLSTTISYQLIDSQWGDVFADIDELNYSQQPSPSVYLRPRIEQVLHGSCRQAHHHSDDALVAADHTLAHSVQEQRPDLLLMSGDQVYIDDIAGPMLMAIAQVIRLLGLPQEHFSGAAIPNSQAINYDASALYLRHKNLLPTTDYPAATPLGRWYRNHPIFTSSLAENHLVSVSEIMALYLLVWSPELWQWLDIPKQLPGLSAVNQLRWQQQWQELLMFKAGLSKVRRLLAHVPVYMIFDDHDITDDWNLTAKWEQAAYGHEFSRQIIGNALIGYSLFQCLGNRPERFCHELSFVSDWLNRVDYQAETAYVDSQQQAQVISRLLSYSSWGYELETQPKVVVLDTRTQRWHRESNLAKPSGLMDWEALSQFQHNILGHDQVIIVSPAPMFGVKLIETIQKAVTMIGGSLLVDAENWMAHPGAANTLLSIFRHRRTPEQFVILSGDVHYSFAYDIHIRFRHGGPQIHQITASGFKNQFPEKLLPWFDRINRWLYGYASPLNWFTRRKRMVIRSCRPNHAKQQRLVNKSGFGRVYFDEQGRPTQVQVVHGDQEITEFFSPNNHHQQEP